MNLATVIAIAIFVGGLAIGWRIGLSHAQYERDELKRQFHAVDEWARNVLEKIER